VLAITVYAAMTFKGYQRQAAADDPCRVVFRRLSAINERERASGRRATRTELLPSSVRLPVFGVDDDESDRTVIDGDESAFQYRFSVYQKPQVQQ
jgi:hypothetical protein